MSRTAVDNEVVERILEKRLNGGRLNLEEGILLFHADLTLLGEAANQIRDKLHPDPVVTFVIDRNIATTNACVIDCDFCAFYQTVPKGDAVRRYLDGLHPSGD